MFELRFACEEVSKRRKKKSKGSEGLVGWSVGNMPNDSSGDEPIDSSLLRYPSAASVSREKRKEGGK